MCACQQKLERLLKELEEAQNGCEALTRQLDSHKLHSKETVKGKISLIECVKIINWRVKAGSFFAGGPVGCCGEGSGLEGGLLAGAGGRAAEHRLLFGEGAGAGERTAQQGGTETCCAETGAMSFHQNYKVQARSNKYLQILLYFILTQERAEKASAS